MQPTPTREMKLTIGIVSAGSMGAAVGQRINESGLFNPILTITARRSEATRTRAEKAGLVSIPSLQELVSSTDIILSILPPSDAVSFATNVVESLANRADNGAGFTFIDCNAISPATVRKIAKLFEPTNATFVDGSIIGGPPREGYSPTIYISGSGDAAATLLASIEGCGVVIKALKGPVGAASALKMSYASMTKGFSALAALSVLGASQNDVLPDLLEELALTQPRSLAAIKGAASSLALKSYRWVGEMEEIASYLGETGIGEGEETFRGIAKFFERTDREKDGAEGDVLREASNAAGELLEKNKKISG